MKALIALAIIAASQVSPAAQKAVEPEAAFLTVLAKSNYNYIASRDDPKGMRISVFGEQTNPTTICELADKHPKVNVKLVKNAHTDVTAYCALP